MTTEELRDWHAQRAGWTMRCGQWRRDCPERKEYKYHPSHPFPATIDGAASAMPPGWNWTRYETDSGGETWASGPTLAAYTVKALGTGDEIHDRYLLAKLAWESIK